ncbi:MAG: tyrosine-type recombinase/integrase [Bacteroidota bacterium]
MLLERFIRFIEIEKGYSSYTLEAYTKDLHQFDEFLTSEFGLSLFKSEDLEACTPKVLRTWIGGMKDKDWSSSTLSRKLSSVKSYFRFLNQAQITSHNPTQGIRLKKGHKKLPSFLKETETEYLLDQISFPKNFGGYRDKCLLEILYGCGLRRSELIELRTENVDLYGQRLRVIGKGNRERLIPFGKHVREAIISYIAFLRAHGIENRATFFVRKNGESLYPKLVYRIVQKYLTIASDVQQKSPHTLRHTYATHLLNRGADLNAIKELLGHKSLAATQVYTHNSIQKLQKVHKQAHPRSENS